MKIRAQARFLYFMSTKSSLCLFHCVLFLCVCLPSVPVTGAVLDSDLVIIAARYRIVKNLETRCEGSFGAGLRYVVLWCLRLFLLFLCPRLRSKYWLVLSLSERLTKYLAGEY